MWRARPGTWTRRSRASTRITRGDGSGRHWRTRWRRSWPNWTGSGIDGSVVRGSRNAANSPGVMPVRPRSRRHWRRYGRGWSRFGANWVTAHRRGLWGGLMTCWLPLIGACCSTGSRRSWWPAARWTRRSRWMRRPQGRLIAVPRCWRNWSSWTSGGCWGCGRARSRPGAKWACWPQ